MVSSTRHPQYKAWATDSDSNTPMYHDYTLFDITNPADFLKGERLAQTSWRQAAALGIWPRTGWV